MSDARWRVKLPRGAEPPYDVWVNGIAQKQGTDFELEDGELVFDRHLEKEKIGFWRWSAIFFGLFGTYRKNDSVDVQYSLHGTRQLATGLDIAAPPPE